jgi:hypothetical protein
MSPKCVFVVSWYAEAIPIKRQSHRLVGVLAQGVVDRPMATPSESQFYESPLERPKPRHRGGRRGQLLGFLRWLWVANFGAGGSNSRPSRIAETVEQSCDFFYLFSTSHTQHHPTPSASSQKFLTWTWESAISQHNWLNFKLCADSLSITLITLYDCLCVWKWSGGCVCLLCSFALGHSLVVMV